VEIVTVEHTVEVPVVVPAAGPRFDQLALAVVAGLGIGLVWSTARRRTAARL
jgi:hypothetical protein